MQGMMDTVGRIDMIGLTYGEHLIIWGMRRIVTGRGEDSLFLDECDHAFDADGAEAAGAVCVFLCLLGRSARRVFEIAPPGTLTVTRDERHILTLLAAAQAEDTSRLDSHLRWVSVPGYRPALAGAAVALGRLLSDHGHWLSPGVPDMPRSEGVRLRLYTN